EQGREIYPFSDKKPLKSPTIESQRHWKRDAGRVVKKKRTPGQTHMDTHEKPAQANVVLQRDYTMPCSCLTSDSRFGVKCRSRSMPRPITLTDSISLSEK